MRRILILAILLLLSKAAAKNGSDVRVRAIRGVGLDYEPFFLELVTEDSTGLVATGSYMDYRASELSHLPTTIHGIRTPNDSFFWPEIKAEVSHNIDSGWNVIQPRIRAGTPVAITLKPDSPNAWLRFDLEAFRPLIDKYEFGRLTLGNGRSTVFKLKNLRSTETPGRYWAESVLAEGEPFTTRPFRILRIESTTGIDLRAICGYLDERRDLRTELKGMRAADGSFWPNASAQAAIDLAGPWRDLGQTSSTGIPATVSIQADETANKLYFDLQIFRSLFGKFRYGRLVLPNGKAATFEMRSLLPPDQG